MHGLVVGQEAEHDLVVGLLDHAAGLVEHRGEQPFALAAQPLADALDEFVGCGACGTGGGLARRSLPLRRLARAALLARQLRLLRSALPLLLALALSLIAPLRLWLPRRALGRGGGRGFDDLTRQAIDNIGQRQLERQRGIGIGAHIGVGERAQRGDGHARIGSLARFAQLLLFGLAQGERTFRAGQQQQHVTQVGYDLLFEAQKVDGVGLHCAEHGQPGAELLAQRGADQFERAGVGAEPERLLRGFERYVVAAGGPELVEQVHRVAQRAGRFAGDQPQRVVADRDAFGVGDRAQPPNDVVDGHAAEVVALAAAEDGRFERFGVGGGEDEDDVRGRLFERFEQRVGGRAGQLVHLVDQIDLEAGGAGLVVGALAQLADVVDAAVAGGVDFDQVEAERVRAAVERGGAGRDAVDRAGEDSRGGGFAGATRAAEEIGVGDLVLLDGVAQGAHHGVLPRDVVEFFRPPLAIENGTAHGDSVRPSVCADLPPTESGRRRCSGFYFFWAFGGDAGGVPIWSGRLAVFGFVQVCSGCVGVGRGNGGGVDGGEFWQGWGCRRGMCGGGVGRWAWFGTPVLV